MEQIRGLKQVSGIKSRKNKDMITSMSTTTGTTETDRQSIANIFATFYEDLYKRREPQDRNNNTNCSDAVTPDPTNNDTHQNDNKNNPADGIPPFSLEELQQSIGQLRNGKCKDTSGIIAEMIKAGGQQLEQQLLWLFNDIARPDAIPPTQWKHTVISVLYKSGDHKLPQNYRPISIIPLLYKLFARLLYNRLEPLLDQHQSPDQAGFRHDYCTTDHLFTTTVLQERCHEWQLNLWVATVDFQKAFDTISHHQLWTTLTQQGVPEAYVRQLQTLYQNQSATVKTDKQSRSFSIQRGVKQGDPLSSLLFNACLEQLFKHLKQKWASQGFGIQLGFTPWTLLTNLPFADDVLLTAPTQSQLTQMLMDLKDEASRYGLKIHPDKTKILTNVSRRRGRDARTKVELSDEHVDILPFSGDAKYLGHKLTFDNYHSTELNNRISSTWRKFNLLRHELTSKTYPLKSRLRLFDSAVTTTMMYACESWTLTKDMTTTLKRTQRRMLRLILNTPRRRAQPPHHDNTNSQSTDDQSTDDVNSITSNMTDFGHLLQCDDEEFLEPWPDFIKRATRIAEELASKFNIQDWTTQYLRRKWRWSRRIAQQSHDRWSWVVSHWEPQLNDKRPRNRHSSRPRKRWDDDINEFLQTTDHRRDDTTQCWQNLAVNSVLWTKLEDKFIEYMQQRSTAPTATSSNTANATT